MSKALYSFDIPPQHAQNYLAAALAASSAVSPDHSLHHVSGDVRGHFPGRPDPVLDHVVAAAPVVVPNTVALGAVADRTVPVVRGALDVKARAHGQLVARAAVLQAWWEGEGRGT